MSFILNRIYTEYAIFRKIHAIKCAFVTLRSSVIAEVTRCAMFVRTFELSSYKYNGLGWLDLVRF